LNVKLPSDNFINLQGYSEQTLEDVIFVCALFGFANRIVVRFAIEYAQKRDRSSSQRLAKGYRLQ